MSPLPAFCFSAAPAGRALETASAPRRAVAAACAAATGAWLTAHVLGGAPLGPPAVALFVAVAVMALPRLGWLCSIAVLAGVTALNGRTGAAGVILIVAVLTTVVQPRRPAGWPAPAAAVALAFIGLTGAWPAVVIRLRVGVWQRAALAGCGFLWLAAAGPLAGIHLFTARPKLPLPAVWTASLPVTLHDVLKPLAVSGVLQSALIWAAAAAVLPWLTHRGRPAWNVGVVTVWSAMTVSALEVVGPSHLYGLVLGALAGAVLLLVSDVAGLLSPLRGGDWPKPRVS